MSKNNAGASAPQEKKPLFGLRTLKNSVKWFYFSVFAATASAGWSVWIDVNNAMVPPAPIYNSHGVQTNAWNFADYGDKYVLMTLLLIAIVIGGSWVITHYGKLSSLWRKVDDQETPEEARKRKWNKFAVFASLLFILLAELSGRALVFFYNNQAYDARVWFIALASMGFFVWGVLLSPSVEKIYEEHSQRSEKEEQEVFHKDASDWFRRVAFKRFKKEAKKEVKEMSFAQVVHQLDALAPGFKSFLAEEIVSVQEVEAQQNAIEGQYQLLESRVSSLHNDVQQLPQEVTGKMTQHLETLLAEKMGELQKALLPAKEDNPDPEPPPRGGISIEEEVPEREEQPEEVIVTGELVGAGVPQIMRRFPVGPLNLEDDLKKKSADLKNITPINQGVEIRSRAGRKRLPPVQQVREG